MVSGKDGKNIEKERGFQDLCEGSVDESACFCDSQLRELYVRDTEKDISYYFHRFRYGNLLFQGDGKKHSVFDGEFCHCCDFSKDSFEFQRQLLEIPYERWGHFQSSSPLWEIEIYFDNDFYICACGRDSRPYGYEKLLQILSSPFQKERE